MGAPRKRDSTKLPSTGFKHGSGCSTRSVIHLPEKLGTSSVHKNIKLTSHLWHRKFAVTNTNVVSFLPSLPGALKLENSNGGSLGMSHGSLKTNGMISSSALSGLCSIQVLTVEKQKETYLCCVYSQLSSNLTEKDSSFTNNRHWNLVISQTKATKMRSALLDFRDINKLGDISLPVKSLAGNLPVHDIILIAGPPAHTLNLSIVPSHL